ncbi:hypothetical protein BDE36_3349 [Arcticibacter tournemirensis]|uniref:Alpha-2-macroglobulin family protein n=1 Tax=Arcticibacter tournemirensis TaxID=699437 RepID=A0A5M9H1J4_9SPHI|nr:Ig-like domain-containing alpha-2-macroglobulin family protein [Arcticibacter tournemirensis]KAA8479965.1 hypothetical protein F1649_16175 [Arcticibacter tournemirensis]TQM51570.1 hypothetical protein BDE36_3349 [Arcticibacter tournemirensis]
MPSEKSFTKKQITVLLAFIAVLSIAGITYWNLKRYKKSNYVEYSKYIESFTSGIVSRESAIRIRLASDIQNTYSAGKPAGDDLIEISPDVKGKVYWIDSRTLEFKPDSELDPNQKYDVTFHLDKVMEVPGEMDEFSFDFQTIKPDYEIEFSGLRSASNSSPDKMKLSGTLIMSDTEEDTKVEQLLKVESPYKTTVTWQHNNESRTHQFTIDNITRAERAQAISILWDGSTLDIDKSGKKKFEIPAVGDFKVLDIRAIQDNEQYVLVQFSDPLRIGQELNGLLGITNSEMPAYTIQGSEVKLYPSERLEGNYGVFVNEGIENFSGKKLPRSFNANVFFENRLPSVTIPGKGVILPHSGKLMMPFEAVNLKAVDVTIIKIYGNNIPQYLQENSLDGDVNLRQVAKPIKQVSIRLDDDKSVNLHKKTRFMLDIDKLLRTEPGAIYRIMIGFRPSYSVYSCKGSGGTLSDDENELGYKANIDEDDEFWSRYDNYYPYGYNWDEREDPCSNSYYNRDRWASRSVLASNIGLIAKNGSNNNLTVAVTDILSAEPKGGVTLQFLDYQQQIIGEAKSGSDGIVTIALKRKPYLLVAKNGDERAYLKLDDGSSLPLSRFNTGGEQIQKGLKGFIYGERGVWRPGDSLNITFILDDRENKLPVGHPVSFELYTPQGQLYKRLIRNKGLNGFYAFKTATEQGSPTGNWQAKIKAGGAVFEKRIRIETIMPNRLKIDLSFGGKKILRKDEGLAATLRSEWLFGGAARNLKARVDAFVSADKTSFPKLEDFSFDDPSRPFNSQLQNIYDGNLNEKGLAAFNPNISTEQASPGMLDLNFMVKVFEPGGNFSISQVSLPYSPYPSYVGIRVPKGQGFSGMLVTGKDHPLDIVSVDPSGNSVQGIRDVEVELYKIQWRWWWDEDENSVSNFTQDQYNKLISTSTIRLVNGKGKWNFRVNEPDWGRFLIRVRDPKTGHATGKIVYADWPNWSERLQNENPTEAAMLSFTSDKEKYRVGEDVVLTIPTANNGRALVSIENGSKVIKTWWIDTKKGQTQYRFKAEKEMTPNVFVNITMLQPHSQTVNDLPIRMYGVIPLEIEDPSTQLKPLIAMPEIIRPETRSSISISEAAGKPMTYTVALVDEGLLDITGFKTPDPHAAFYAREGLGVKTWDLFDYVIGAYGGELQRILSIGGDRQSGKANKNPMANRFKPVVKFLGPFRLKSGEKQTHHFTLPQYIGSVKAMVIAGEEGAYGFAEKTVKVKKPLMVLASLPRVLAPGEQIKLPVTVFALENSVKNVTVQLQSNAFAPVKATKTIHFARPGEQMVYFDINTGNFEGIGKVKITARSGRETSAYDVELDVRNPNPLITKVTEKILDAGASWNTSFNTFGTAGTNSASLEVSSIPPVNLQQRLGYLIRYPHGCVEQVTSSVFPQLYLSSLTDLSSVRKAEVSRNIKAGILRLAGFQLPDGGMSYWPGSGTADEWSTSYSGHFMIEAETAGYTLPPAFLPQWKKFQRSKAVSWAPSTTDFYGGDLLQAYRLYLLALARSPELGAMNRLREFKYISPAAKWRLAAAYRIAGQPEIAASLIKGLPLSIKPYRQSYGTFGSDLRDEAMILETLTLMNMKRQSAALVRSIAARLSQQSWYSTQSTAYALIAVSKYCGNNTSGSKLQFAYGLNNSKGNVDTKSFLWQQPAVLNTSKNNVAIRNKGRNRLFVRLITQGKPGIGQETPSENNPDVLTMRVSYFSLNGKLTDPSKLKQGTDFVAQVNIYNPGKRGKYTNMALTQIFPSGWEIINTRLMDQESIFSSSPADYRDIRDDRVNTYFSIEEGKELTYFVLLNASYPGRYYLAPVYCEAMYDGSINASVKGQWVEVLPEN